MAGNRRFRHCSFTKLEILWIARQKSALATSCPGQAVGERVWVFGILRQTFAL